jgi:hypothetical protein
VTPEQIAELADDLGIAPREGRGRRRAYARRSQRSHRRNHEQAHDGVRGVDRSA